MAGRATECARLDHLLAEARLGRSGVLVVLGDAGIGKSALLESAAERAEACRVLRATGVEWEMELPFAGLHQLCADLLDGRERLPSPQRDALSTAFGLSSGAQPDRFLVGLGVLGLLSDAAEERPLVCLVDDVQWLDRSSAQVLAFVARRLAAESVVILFAEREPGLEELAGLAELRLTGLPDVSARQLLASVITAPLDERVRDRILAESQGNPLALLELPRASSPGALAGGFGLPGGESLPRRIEASFLTRVQQLPVATQRLLLLAAADPTGEPALLIRAAAQQGIPTGKLAPAEADGLVRLGLQVAFRHPLLRSAIYRAAPTEQRRSAHSALAAATDAEADPDRRAWHRAHATEGPDDDVARALEQSAGRARARGGLPAAAAFLERAAALAVDPARRARLAFEGAEVKQLAAEPESALALLATAAAGPLDDLDRAMLPRLRGQILLELTHRADDALPHLVDAAQRLEPIDPILARDTHFEAIRAATVAGRLGPGVLAVAKAARAAPPTPGDPRPLDLLVDGLAVRFTDGYGASAPMLKRAIDAIRDEGERGPENVRWPWYARRVAPDLFADDTWHYLSTRGVELYREQGVFAVLPLALHNLAHLRCQEGDLDGAAALLDEDDALAAATGTPPFRAGNLPLAGFRGIETEALPVFEAAEAAAHAQGLGYLLTCSEQARAILYNGLGRYDIARGPAQSAAERDELWISTWSFPEVVESATRCGQGDAANTAHERLAERTRAAGTELALGIEARSRALISEGSIAEQAYQEAIERLAGTRLALERARAHLLYGEWLRRDKRRIDARDQLRRAQEMFTGMGAHAFAERASRELLATGETARKRTADTRDELTPQETQIAQFARDGLSNAEIGARLFISPRTVEYHLHKVFTKLGITTRGHLNRALPGG